MNTPAHLVFAAAAFARPGAPGRNAAALLGGLLPDASLYGLYAWARIVEGRGDAEIFGQLYFSPAWQRLFAIDNSVFLWAAVLVAGLALRLQVLWVLAGAALLHIAFDLPLHHDDGRPHFWPLTDWIFRSPVSYWDPRVHGGIVGGLEALACMVLLALLWRRFGGYPARALIGAAAVAVVLPGVVFGIMFS